MSKIICNFAVLNLLKGGFVRLCIAGFFYACVLIHGVTPWETVIESQPPFKELSNGSVTPFFSLLQKNIGNYA
jgi:uncharacterized membrane protein